jgi:acyl-CoA carboxylase subunit beta
MMVLAMDRLAGTGLISAAGYRKALRALRIAERLRLPVLSLIDTPGAEIGPDADSEGIATWIAECFAALLELTVPVVSVVVGQGSSGGALALAVADRMYMLERSVFSVIAPEGAAAILSKTPHPAAEWAEKLRLSAGDAFDLGLIDGVVPGAEIGRRSNAARVKRVRALVPDVVAELEQRDRHVLVAARLERYLRSTRHLLASA